MKEFKKLEPEIDVNSPDMEEAVRTFCKSIHHETNVVILQELAEALSLNECTRIVIDYDPNAVNAVVRVFRQKKKEYKIEHCFGGTFSVLPMGDKIQVGFSDNNSHLAQLSKEEALSLAQSIKRMAEEM